MFVHFRSCEKRHWADGHLGIAKKWLLVLLSLVILLPASLVGQVSSNSRNDVVAAIDELFLSAWHDQDLRPATEARDGEWCRRVFLDVVGRIPTVAEYESFLNSRDPAKKARLVQRLLYDDAYRNQYADQWSTIWTNVLLGRTGGSGNNSLANRDGMTRYLAECFSENRGYARMADELIRATGTNDPESDGFNGAVNFLCDKLADQATQATAQTARIFLGIRLQCTQCHNHPFNEWKQESFWQLNAFFRQAVPLRRFRAGTNRLAYVELADQDFAGEGSTPEEAEVYFEQRDGILKVAYPVFIDGQPLANRSGFVADVLRRAELARFVVDSPNLAEALVNRYWSYFLGYGLLEPIDDFGPHREANHPDVLRLLAREFRAADYDLKQLIQWITLSRPYSLSSRPSSQSARDDPDSGTAPQFSRFYLRQLRPEDLYRSIVVLSQSEYSQRDLATRPTRPEFLRQLFEALGDDEANETTTFNGTIPQTLMMFNGPLLDAALQLQGESMLQNVARDPKSNDQQKITHLYRACLSRDPTKQEVRAARNLPPGVASLQDLLWALVNSNEFMLNH